MSLTVIQIFSLQYHRNFPPNHKYIKILLTSSEKKEDKKWRNVARKWHEWEERHREISASLKKNSKKRKKEKTAAKENHRNLYSPHRQQQEIMKSKNNSLISNVVVVLLNIVNQSASTRFLYSSHILSQMINLSENFPINKTEKTVAMWNDAWLSIVLRKNSNRRNSRVIQIEGMSDLDSSMDIESGMAWSSSCYSERETDSESCPVGRMA